MWAQLLNLMFELLHSIYQVVGDWGMAIIVITVIVRLVLMPLTVKQMKSMHELQRIQPKIKELQAKYKDNPEKLQEETLKFYAENKVNPFGGCLPMLLQMPIMILLYQVLGNTGGKPGPMLQFFEETGAVGRFYSMIPDISMTPNSVFSQEGLLAALPYIILVALFGLSVWLPQQLQPGEKQQKMIGGYMAVIMLFFGWSVPAGVLLYWDVSSLWGVIQQQIISKYASSHPDVSAEIVVESPKVKSGREGTKKSKKK